MSAVHHINSYTLYYFYHFRAPNLVKPEDHVCERLAPIVYAKCGPSDIDATVDEAIESLKSSLQSVGPYLSKGIILISFFEKRDIKGFFGLVNSTENIYFERWRIPVLIDERPLLPAISMGNYNNYNNYNDIDDRNNNYHHNTLSKEAAETEKKYLVDSALQAVQKRVITILEVFSCFRNSSRVLVQELREHWQ